MADEVYTENSEQTAETAANIMNITGQNDSKAENNRKKKKRADDGEDYGIFGTIYDAVSVIVASMVIISVVFTFCFRLVGVDGPSMNNTLTNGDWLIVTPYYSEPKYKDIVISTKKTAAEGNLVKRVIAVAGDVVDITDEGKVIVNGNVLHTTMKVLAEDCRYREIKYYADGDFKKWLEQAEPDANKDRYFLFSPKASESR